MPEKEETFLWVVERGQAGQRLDIFLAHCTKMSRRAIRKLISQGSVFVDGDRVKVQSRVLKKGVSVKLTQAKAFAPVSTVQCPILFEDKTLVAVNKPAYCPSTPTRQGSVNTALEITRQNVGCTLFVLHRIDFETSGALLFAKDKKTAALFSERFAQGQMQRTYLAWTQRGDHDDHFTIDAPLTFDTSQRRARVDESGKRSISHVTILTRTEQHCLCRIHIETGRTHQIRAHLADVEMPLVGDVKYGGERPRKDFFGLHAETLSYGKLHLRAPLSEAFYTQLEPHLDAHHVDALLKDREESP